MKNVISEPKLEELIKDEVRSCEEIARRALAVFGVVGLALGAPRNDIVSWLQDEALWAELTPTELQYVAAEAPTEKQTINASWQSEAVIVLLWALQKIEELPAPNEQCDTWIFQELLPPFADISVAEFIASAHCRSEEELHDMSRKIMHFHWEARDAEIHSQPAPAHVDIDIIHERNRAINWIIRYDDLPWDEVTTDT